MRQIPVRSSPGEFVFALVDEDCFERLSEFPWHLNLRGYARRSFSLNGRTKNVMMAREIMGVTDPKIQVDHKNRNKLDNRRANLRLVSNLQNHQNVPAKRNSTSRFRGVSWCKRTQKWQASASVNRRAHFLGRFDSEEEAAEAALAFRRVNMEYAID